MLWCFWRKDANNYEMSIKAGYTIFACGGIGGLYDHSTNYPHLTGDAIAIAIQHGIKLENVDYVQIHPTTLYTKKKRKSLPLLVNRFVEKGLSFMEKTESVLRMKCCHAIS